MEKGRGKVGLKDWQTQKKGKRIRKKKRKRKRETNEKKDM